MPNNFDERCREIAERFLVSAVVVDDQPYHGGAEQVGPLRTPVRGGRTVDDEKTGRGGGQSLDAGAITESFSKIGLICGVVKPAPDENDAVVTAVERADLVVIDWQLHDDNGERALKLINSILDSDQDKDQRLRLIAVYTGESNIGRIGERINEKLDNRYDLKNRTRERHVTLSRGHCRIVIYSKEVREADLPGRLIDDFARMTEGLMPSIALVALTAVRENPHRILDKFDGKLDAAFLAHRACLPIPDDSAQHVVAQIASELRAIMEEEVGRDPPKWMEAIKLWIEKFKGNGDIVFEKDPVPQKNVLDMLEKGVDATKVRSNRKRESPHLWLTDGFVRPDDPKDIDRRLAWMMCFRAIDPPDKRLWLGTAVRRCGSQWSGCPHVESGSEFLLCLRPRCDSVRMVEQGSFLFLPLLIDPKPGKFQIVVRSNASGPKYRQVGLETDMSRWEMIEFEPDPIAKAVVAQGEQSGSAGYVFTDVCGNCYEWIGELKTEVAHSVGQILSATLSRIALDRSEWLRRSER